MVTNDSGPMHISACFDSRALVIMGPTKPEKTGPYKPAEIVLKDLPCVPCLKRVCPRNDAPMECLTTITPSEILDKLRLRGWIE